jgi:glycerol-3-phosphate dehydrogenase
MCRAEDAVDKVIEVTPELQSQRLSRCRTLETHFIGYDGYSENLQARLIQQYNVTSRVARRLARAYGGRAVDVIKIAKEIAEEKKARQEKNGKDRGGMVEEDPTATEQFVFDLELGDVVSEGYAGPEALLVPDYPFIEAEVVFGVRYDWVMRPEDFLARRTRLAFLNKDAALRAIPRVVQLMARELKWNRARQSAEIQRCVEFMRHFGGSKPVLKGPSVRLATRADLRDVFRKAKPQHAQGLTRDTLQLASEMLNHVLTQEELEDCLQYAESIPYSDHMSASTGAGAAAAPSSVYPHAPTAFAGVISFEAFEGWWNSERLNPGLVELKASKSANVSQIQGSGALFG